MFFQVNSDLRHVIYCWSEKQADTLGFFNFLTLDVN